MSQTPWHTQIAYYRHRAAEYDLTSYEDVPRADLAGSGEIVERQLQDGTRHQLVKLVRDQHSLTRQLTELGWHATITKSGPDWLLGEARPALRP